MKVAPYDLTVTRMRNLAPDIHRQRMIAEWRQHVPVSEPAIRAFSVYLAGRMAMEVIDLSVSYADPFGLGAGCHWKYSGWSLMAWDAPDDGGLPFATLDLHCCKPYDYQTVITCIEVFFRPAELAWAPVLPELAAGT